MKYQQLYIVANIIVLYDDQRWRVSAYASIVY